MSSTTQSARAGLKGHVDSRYDGKVTQYRGISYTTIKKRFARPVLNTQWQKTTDCTNFGPRCPQISADIVGLMQLPKTSKPWPKEKEDEFKCTNLTVSCPSDTTTQNLPVLFWIHGGSQVNSFGSSSQQLGDTSPLVAQSVEIGKPVVVVSIHYRLNMFAFGDHESELNLDLQDQRVAVEWVKKNIATFGGDPANITLIGESAGAVYIHAHVTSGMDVARVVLHSGSLYATPPQPDKRGLGLIGLVEGNLALIEMEKGNMDPGAAKESTLAGTPVERVVQTLRDLQIGSKWTWEEKAYKDWQQVDKVFGKLKGVMLGDCEAEGVLFEKEMNSLTAKQIMKVLEAVPSGAGKKVAAAYGITATDDTESRKAAVQLGGDIVYSWPARELSKKLGKAGINVHRFLFDQADPFAKTNASAYHGIDLLAIFGGYDDVVGDEMMRVGKVLRNNLITFAHGGQPWTAGRAFAYGPSGKMGEISDEEASSRRREVQFQVLDDLGFTTCQEIWSALLSAGATAMSD